MLGEAFGSLEESQEWGHGGMFTGVGVVVEAVVEVGENPSFCTGEDGGEGG